MNKHRADAATRQNSRLKNLLEYLNSTNKNRITPFIISHHCTCSLSIYLEPSNHTSHPTPTRPTARLAILLLETKKPSERRRPRSARTTTHTDTSNHRRFSSQHLKTALKRCRCSQTLDPPSSPHVRTGPSVGCGIRRPPRATVETRPSLSFDSACFPETARKESG